MSSVSVAWRDVRVVLLAVGLMLAVAGTAKSEATFLGLTFPDQVADADIGPTKDYEGTSPGLGYNVRYVQPGWTMDVFIYDLRRRSIPDNVESEVVKRQLKQAQGDIIELERRGVYAQVDLKRSYLLRDDRGRPRFQCSDFAYVHEKVGAVDSALCLTAWRGKFVKFRLTTARHAGWDAEVKRFMDAWISILWP